MHTLGRAVRLVEQLGELSEPSDFAPVVLPALAELMACHVLAFGTADKRPADACYGGAPLRTTRLHRTRRCGEPVAEHAGDHRIYLAYVGAGAMTIRVTLRDGRVDLDERDQAILDVLGRPLVTALTRLRQTGSRGADAGLTTRELAVLRLVGLGRTNAAIAHAMGISPRTVAKHLEHVYRKLDVCNRAAAVSRQRR